MNSLLL